MADNPFGGGGMAGGAGASSGRGSATVGGANVISPLAIPELLKLFQQAQNQIPRQGEMDSIQGMIQGGMQSPLLQAVLGPAMERLRAPQQLQQQQFTEAARASGGLRGSTYGQGLNTLMQNQSLQQNDLMGAVIQQVLGQLLQGQLQEQRQSFLPAEALTSLLKAASPSVSRGGASASSGWENIPPSLGLGTPMQSDLSAAGGGNMRALNPGAGGWGNVPSTGTGMITPPQQPQVPGQYVDPWSSPGYQSNTALGIDSMTGLPLGGAGGMGGIEYGEWQDMAPYENSFF